MQDELMTPAISGNSQPLSSITVGALEDLGYTVDYNMADAYGSADLGFAPVVVASAALVSAIIQTPCAVFKALLSSMPLVLARKSC